MINRAFIVPTYNESETIGSFLEKLTQELRENEFIVVVDDSSVEERDKLKEILENYSTVRLLEGNVKGGRGYAVWRGMLYALQESPEITHLVETDCDGSHRFEDIKQVSNFEESVEFVIGSRYLPGSRILGWSLSRKVMSRLLNYIIPRILCLQIKDVTNGLRRYSRRSAKILVADDPKTRGFIYLSEQAKILRSKNIIASEVPIVFASRVAGESSVTVRDLLISLKGLLQILFLKRS